MIIRLGSAARGRAPAGHLAAIAVAVLAVAAAAAGCAAVPTDGPVQQVATVQGGASQPQEYPQPIAVGPGPAWSPTQIVDGFLAASASFASNRAVAQEYLDATARRNWRPGWAATVVSKLTTFSVPSPKELSDATAAGQSASSTPAIVQVSGQAVATVTATGQYQVSSGPSAKPMNFDFTLIKVHGLWRIDGLPADPLPLTTADFNLVYQPWDLYFVAPSGNVLVPDPVFAPQEPTNTEMATGLVNALLQSPSPTSWLGGAATTAFPAGSTPVGQVKIIGPNATVNLTGPAARVSRSRLQRIAAQLVWTLAGGPTGIHSVELELNGHPQQIRGALYQLQQSYRGWVPAQPAGSSLYYIGDNGAVEELCGAAQSGSCQPGRPTPVAGPAGAGGGPALSSIAISPNERTDVWLAGISADGSTVYTSDLSRGGALRKWRSPSGTCTSVSWDQQGNLWIAAGGDLWLMQPGSDSANQVGLQALAAADNVTDFRVAPDGVRAVMIVGTPAGEQVQLAAITHEGTSATVGPTVTLGAEITSPQALSWYGTDNVIVMSDAGQGTQLDEVLLNGGQVTPYSTPSDATSMTAASPGSGPGSSGLYAAVGMSSGQIMISAGGLFEAAHVSGRDPVYPG